jgi:hypothetical protein
MPLPSHEVWLTDDHGVRLAQLTTFSSLVATRQVNAIGWIEAVLPPDFDTSLIRLDNMIQFWRQPAGGALSLWRPYFIREWRWETSGGDETLTVSGPDCNDLLRRRIVAAYSSSPEANKEDYADDMLKEYLSEAIVDTGDLAPDAGSRQWADLGIAADISAGPTLTKSSDFGRLLLLSGTGLFPDIAQAAREAGTEVFFDIVPDNVSSNSIDFEFRTYTGQPGQDVSDRVVFAKENGNLSDPFYEFDASEEINYVYAGGQGEGQARNIQQVYDADRYNTSQWNRCEAFSDARNQSTDNGVREAGRALLESGRPVRRFGGDPIDTEGTRFGVHWDHGYKVRAVYREEEFDAIVRSTVISVKPGEEAVQARLEYEGD